MTLFTPPAVTDDKFLYHVPGSPITPREFTAEGIYDASLV